MIHDIAKSWALSHSWGLSKLYVQDNAVWNRQYMTLASRVNVPPCRKNDHDSPISLRQTTSYGDLATVQTWTNFGQGTRVGHICVKVLWLVFQLIILHGHPVGSMAKLALMLWLFIVAVGNCIFQISQLELSHNFTDQTWQARNLKILRKLTRN